MASGESRTAIRLIWLAGGSATRTDPVTDPTTHPSIE